MNPIIRNYTDNSWVFITLLIILLLLAISRWIFQKNYATLNNFKDFIETQENFFPFSLFTNLLLAILLGLILYPFIDLPAEMNNWTTSSKVLILIGFVVIYLLIRFTFNFMLVYLLGLGDRFREIFKTKLFFRVFAVLLLIIANLLMYFSDIPQTITFLISIAIFGATLLLEYLFQLNKNEYKSAYGSYYFILYLCVLEILPILYVVRHWNGLEI